MSSNFTPNSEQSATPVSAQPALSPDAYKVLADVLGGSSRAIHYRPYFAHAFGGVCSALLLSQFWFWTNTPIVRGRADGWFWKSQKEITEETGLTRSETLTARRKLVALGVIQEELRGVPATLHFHIEKEILFIRLWEHIQAHPADFPGSLPPQFAENLQTGAQETCKLVRGKPAKRLAGNLQAISETTQEKNIKEDRNPLNVARDAPPQPPASPRAGARTANGLPEGQKTLSRNKPQKAEPTSQAEVPQAEVPQAEVPQAEVPQAEVPQAEVPQAEVPQAEVPQAEVPQAEVPQAEVPQAKAPQAEVPQAKAPQPQPSQIRGIVPKRIFDLAQTVVELTGDEHSRKRFEQLAGITDSACLNGQWKAAYAATSARMHKTATPLEKPGAYFNATITRLLQAEGIYVPIGSKEERTDIRRQIRQSLASADAANAANADAANAQPG